MVYDVVAMCPSGRVRTLLRKGARCRWVVVNTAVVLWDYQVEQLLERGAIAVPGMAVIQLVEPGTP